MKNWMSIDVRNNYINKPEFYETYDEAYEKMLKSVSETIGIPVPNMREGKLDGFVDANYEMLDIDKWGVSYEDDKYRFNWRIFEIKEELKGDDIL